MPKISCQCVFVHLKPRILILGLQMEPTAQSIKNKHDSLWRFENLAKTVVSFIHFSKNVLCNYFGLYYKFCKFLNKICSVTFLLVLGSHNYSNNHNNIYCIIYKHSFTTFWGYGNFKPGTFPLKTQHRFLQYQYFSITYIVSGLNFQIK